jgi:hypothetical protein
MAMDCSHNSFCSVMPYSTPGGRLSRTPKQKASAQRGLEFKEIKRPSPGIIAPTPAEMALRAGKQGSAQPDIIAGGQAGAIGPGRDGSIG